MSEYGSLREKIAAEKVERQGRYAKFEAAYAKAAEAGRAAGEAAMPRPMVVNQMAGLSNVVEKSYYVPEGMCGFAWVSVSPGNSSFAKWLVKEKLARAAYRGGVEIWISAFNQSVERKESCARAMAKVLNEELADSKLRIYPGSRLD